MKLSRLTRTSPSSARFCSTRIIYYGDSHPAKPSALVAAIIAAAIPSQMMANVTTGAMSAADAVKDAHDKIVQIFEEGGVPQS